ncbi:MAG: T9SS type A sorting domain-containing protein [Bacteroidota bacterium]|nr:T9SS type A sorting domain-containing protein [Bacteroidota bacterium]
MESKLFLLIVTVITIFCNSANAQYKIIYEAPINRQLKTIYGYNNIHNEDLAFYIDLDGDLVTSAPPYWIRWYKNNNSFIQNPHYNYLNGSTCYTGQGGFEWSKVGYFTKSFIDTNFILTRGDWTNCQWFESWYANALSANSGFDVTILNNVGMYDFDIDRINDSIIYGVGSIYLSQCKFWKSTNRGFNWSEIQASGMNYFDRPSIKINPLNRNGITIASNKLWKSYDAGSTINFISDLPIYASDLLIDYADSSLYIFNSIHGIYKSTNGGLNFFQCSEIHCNKLLIDPDNHNVLYAGTDNGLFRSIDGGNIWSLYFNNFNNSNDILGIVKYKNDGDTVFVSNYFSVYKVWESLVNINIVSNNIPAQILLSQNYPNPFNPTTHLEFRISNLEFVSLKVYDILGNEVTTLVNENKPAGNYSVEFNGEGLPSGIYFYKLETENFSETKRMILLK